MFAILVGILSAIAVIVVMARISLKKFMGYPVITDICVTLFLACLLAGTFAGITAALVGGLVFSALITVIRKLLGYQRIGIRKMKPVWVDYPPSINLNGVTKCWK